MKSRVSGSVAIYAMLNKKTHYVDKTVDFEALMVVRNAPRWLQMLVNTGLFRHPPDLIEF